MVDWLLHNFYKAGIRNVGSLLIVDDLASLFRSILRYVYQIMLLND